MRSSDIHLRTIPQEIHVPLPSITKIRFIGNYLKISSKHSRGSGVNGRQPYWFWHTGTLFCMIDWTDGGVFVETKKVIGLYIQLCWLFPWDVLYWLTVASADALWHWKIWSLLVEVMACRLLGTMPSLMAWCRTGDKPLFELISCLIMNWILGNTFQWNLYLEFNIYRKNGSSLIDIVVCHLLNPLSLSNKAMLVCYW